MKVYKIFKTSLFGKVDDGFYRENKVLLDETNFRLLKKACIFSFCMCAFLLVLTFFNDLVRELHVFYFGFTVFFALETLAVLFYVKKHKNLSGLFFYIYAVAILLLAATVGTVYSASNYAVTFYVFLIIIPMLHVGRPLYAALLSIIACIGFCILTHFVKSDHPSVAANDILNAVCCCIVGIGLSITIINSQLDNLQSKVHLEKLSSIDELTSLPNRRSFNTYMQNIFNDKDNDKNISIVMIDIDDFKSYNDTYGHLKGDECLRQIGKLLQDVAEKNKLFVSRFGGEEFVAVSTSHDAAAIAAICEGIVREVQALNIVHSSALLKKVTLSIGYADARSSASKNDIELVICADSALYLSKLNGKNRVTRYKILGN